MPLYYSDFETPCGPARAVVDEASALVALILLKDGQAEGGAPLERYTAGFDAEEMLEDAGRCAEVLKQMREYFDGTRREFTLTLAPRGSAFQRRVWAELCNIPYGTTISYAAMAERLGDPLVIRAAARANGANPIWIVVPCHRVIGSDGKMTGYGGGIPVKRWLLEHEGALQPQLFAV